MFSEQKGFKAQITKQFIGIMVVIIIGVAVRNFWNLKNKFVVFPVSYPRGCQRDRKCWFDWDNEDPCGPATIIHRNRSDLGSRWTLLGSQPCIPTNLG